MSTVINMVCSGGGGDASANFIVNGYAEEKTTAGSDNEIQVYPAADMTDYVIQMDEPTDISDGLVWITFGKGRFEFEPISNVPIFVPISGAKIFRSSAWEDVNVKCYIDGEWLPNIIWLYKDGENYGLKYQSIYWTAHADKLENHSSSSSATWTRGNLWTNNVISTVGYSKIHISYSFKYDSNHSIQFGLSTDNTTEGQYSSWVNYAAESKQTNEDFQFDLTNYQGEYYIRAWLHTSSTNSGTFVYKIWMD